MEELFALTDEQIEAMHERIGALHEQHHTPLECEDAARVRKFCRAVRRRT